MPNIAVFRRYIEVRKRSPQHLQVHFILLYVASPICWHHVPFMHPRNIIFSPSVLSVFGPMSFVASYFVPPLHALHLTRGA